MAVALAIWPRRAPSPSAPTLRPSTEQVAPRPATDAARIGGEVVPLWLDGAELDVDLSLVPSGLLAEPAPGPGGADAAGFEEASPPDERGLLPATDLAWVDGLDDEALARAERWLAEHKT
jgi:hypothetical protein